MMVDQDAWVDLFFLGGAAIPQQMHPSSWACAEDWQAGSCQQVLPAMLHRDMQPYICFQIEEILLL